MDENFLNLERKMDIQIHDAQRTPNWLNMHKAIPRYIIIKFANIKHKERILKAIREKKTLYTGIPPSHIRLSVDFLMDNFRPGENGMTFSEY